MHAAARVRRARAPAFIDPPAYARHRPETTQLYQRVERYWPEFRRLRARAGRPLPAYVEQEFDAYLKCGRLEEGFLRLRCEQCRAEKLVAFSCRKRGFCPSCGARRMAETAALLADEVLPEQPLRQWVLSLPMALRFLLATRPAVVSEVLGAVYRTISGHLLALAGVRRAAGHTGSVTLIQRFGSALNLNVHFHMIFVDGVYVTEGSGAPVFRAVRSPGAVELQALVQQMAERIGRLLEKRDLIESGIGQGAARARAACGSCTAGSVGGVTLPGGRGQRTPCAGVAGAGPGRVALDDRGAGEDEGFEGHRVQPGRVSRVDACPRGASARGLLPEGGGSWRGGGV